MQYTLTTNYTSLSLWEDIHTTQSVVFSVRLSILIKLGLSKTIEETVKVFLATRLHTSWQWTFTPLTVSLYSFFFFGTDLSLPQNLSTDSSTQSSWELSFSTVTFILISLLCVFSQKIIIDCICGVCIYIQTHICSLLWELTGWNFSLLSPQRKLHFFHKCPLHMYNRA